MSFDFLAILFGIAHPRTMLSNLFYSLKDFLPKEYAKLRGQEKKIFQQHAELYGLSEVEAKVKYCQFCRSLKTYGITFFLVKVSSSISVFDIYGVACLF